MIRRSIGLAAAAVVASTAAFAATAFHPPTFPTNVAPVDWPGNPGSRYEMPVYAEKIPPARRDLVVKVHGGTEEQWRRNDMGAYKVGDQIRFDVVVGDKESRHFGSMKDRRDGGLFQAAVFWMDEAGKNVLLADTTLVKAACASCAGFPGLYLNVPSFAKQGRHRLNLTYVHGKLGIDLSKDLTFAVQNDGSWDRNPVLDRLSTNCQSVIVLQSGRPVKELGVASYDGCRDTYMTSPHTVADRRADHCNFGKDVKVCVGSYGMENRALLSFDLANVPKGAALAEAHLQLYCGFMPGRGGTLTPQAFDVLKPWNEGRGHADYYLSKKAIQEGETAWRWSLNPQAWARPGCDEPGVDRSAAPVGAPSAPLRQTQTWVSVALDTNLVARWIRDPASNHGVLLMDPKGARADFHASEFEDPAMRPRLILAFSSGFLAPAMCSPDGACPLPKAAR